MSASGLTRKCCYCPHSDTLTDLLGRSGPNPIINPADIERLEALEAETQEALDQATLLTTGPASAASIRALARKLDTIMGELPPNVLRQALK
jgi:hypothetical protein